MRMFGRLKIPLFSGIFAVLSIVGFSQVVEKQYAPAIVDGYLDLTQWDFVKDGKVVLNGNWEFYWDTLMTPKDFPTDLKPVYPYFPSLWSDIEIHGENLSNFGYATYRSRIVINNTGELLAVKLPDYYTSYKLWLNGKVLSENGTVGTSKKTEVPYIQPLTQSFYPKTDTLSKLLSQQRRCKYCPCARIKCCT